MNWARLRRFAWLDTRANFVARTPKGGALLDLGSSDGETLGHIAELRPDLRLYAVDAAGRPERHPPGVQVQRAEPSAARVSPAGPSMDALNPTRPLLHPHDTCLPL